MILLVGLGNPGSKYARNRHNAGFHAVEAIADAHGFTPERKKFRGLLREGTIKGQKVITLRPGTFYNEAGNAVGAAAKFYKIPVDDIVVFHDEIDLAPGKVRVKKGGGLAGNNGLKSINAHMGPDFWRVRIGIGHPGRKEAVTNWVLGDFSKAEHEAYYDEVIDRMGSAIPALLSLDDTGAGRFMSGIAQPGAAATEKKPADKKDAPAPSSAPATKEPAQKKSSPFDILKALKKD
ncbi:aminoacyl-tRNA hydrolase [Parvularcula marina]|uniref:aminoacyl-tRNA hydrolase n=1 Tax=Parvularcula marina TaxID=2292771 RepID=UPI003516BA8E